MKSPKQMPAFRAYTATKRQNGEKDFWLPIGAAFAHRDQQGFNIVLQAVPIDGRVILRPIGEQPPEARNDNAANSEKIG